MIFYILERSGTKCAWLPLITGAVHPFDEKRPTSMSDTGKNHRSQAPCERLTDFERRNQIPRPNQSPLSALRLT